MAKSETRRKLETPCECGKLETRKRRRSRDWAGVFRTKLGWVLAHWDAALGALHRERIAHSHDSRVQLIFDDDLLMTRACDAQKQHDDDDDDDNAAYRAASAIAARFETRLDHARRSSSSSP